MYKGHNNNSKLYILNLKSDNKGIEKNTREIYLTGHREHLESKLCNLLIHNILDNRLTQEKGYSDLCNTS